MCVAIPLGRGSDGPRGTRFGRFLRAQPWRFTALVPMVGSALLVVLWVFGSSVPDAGLLLAMISQGLVAAPLFGVLMTWLPIATGTSSLGHLWFAGLSLVLLVGVVCLSLCLLWGPVWEVPGLLGLGLGWWLAARALSWHLGWSRVRLPWLVRLMPINAYLGAAALAGAALALALGKGVGLVVMALMGSVLTAALGCVAGLVLVSAGRFGMSAGGATGRA